MSGLDDKQWAAVESRLSVIDDMSTEVKSIKTEVKDTNLSVNRLQVEVASINTSLFGVNKQNGLNSQIKKNTEAIEELKRNMPKKPTESTSKKIRGWIPVIICVIMSIASLYAWVESSITKNIQQQNALIQANPTP